MKVLIMIGSPKKTGETVRQAHLHGEVLQREHNIAVEYLPFADYRVTPCRGCQACFDRGETACPLQDDVPVILDKMAQADGLIVVSPVYAMHISSILKIFIDRVAFLDHRPRFFGKPAFVIAVKGQFFPDGRRYLKNVLHYWGYTYVGASSLAAIEHLPERRRAQPLRAVHKDMQRYAQALQNPKIPTPGLTDLINFQMWQYRASLKGSANADYRYFQETGLDTQDFWVATSISTPKKIGARALFALTLWYMRREMGDLARAI